MVAENDGVSVRDVAARGIDDLCLRLARLHRVAEKRKQKT